MKYTKYIQSHGDGIAKTLHKIRQQYCDAWTDSMASYACTKIGRLPCITWREAVPAGIKAPAKQYITFEEVNPHDPSLHPGRASVRVDGAFQRGEEV